MGEPSYLNEILKVRDVTDKRVDGRGAGKLRSTLTVDQSSCSENTVMRKSVFLEQLAMLRDTF